METRKRAIENRSQLEVEALRRAEPQRAAPRHQARDADFQSGASAIVFGLAGRIEQTHSCSSNLIQESL